MVVVDEKAKAVVDILGAGGDGGAGVGEIGDGGSGGGGLGDGEIGDGGSGVLVLEK